MNSFISHILKKHLSSTIQLKTLTPVSGGCINSTFHVETNQGAFFVKCNKESLAAMFTAEAKGLNFLALNSPLKVPLVLGEGVYEEKSYLIMEWLSKGYPSSNFWKKFATDLASQHRISSPFFGFEHDNFIGSLPQSNLKHTSWSDFFIHERLLPQLDLGSSKNLIASSVRTQFERLFNQLKEIIPEEPPALLHGDLWSGNFMINESGGPAIFDPAVHYGHRETELAFTQLFGGFSIEFYQYYREEFPLEPGLEQRIDVHNLYPLLVHVNLFGSSYLSGILNTLKRFN